MNDRNWEKIERAVEQIARDAGDLILSMEHPAVSAKEGRANFVTEADVASQKQIIQALKPLLPEAGFLAEEGEGSALPDGLCWVIDPIDGTTNFMRGYRHSAISIGLVEKGAGLLGVVYNPYTGEMFHAIRGGGAYCGAEKIQAAQVPLENAIVMFGSSPYYRELTSRTFAIMEEVFQRCGDIRRSGSAALDLCSVAAGRCDGFFEARLSPWDFAASAVILAEAGAVISDAGRPLDFGKVCCICAGAPAVHRLIVECAGL